jgi:hypothetical protein
VDFAPPPPADLCAPGFRSCAIFGRPPSLKEGVKAWSQWTRTRPEIPRGFSCIQHPQPRAIETRKTLGMLGAGPDVGWDTIGRRNSPRARIRALFAFWTSLAFRGQGMGEAACPTRRRRGGSSRAPQSSGGARWRGCYGAAESMNPPSPGTCASSAASTCGCTPAPSSSGSLIQSRPWSQSSCPGRTRAHRIGLQGKPRRA